MLITAISDHFFGVKYISENQYQNKYTPYTSLLFELVFSLVLKYFLRIAKKRNTNIAKAKILPNIHRL